MCKYIEQNMSYLKEFYFECNQEPRHNMGWGVNHWGCLKVYNLRKAFALENVVVNTQNC